MTGSSLAVLRDSAKDVSHVTSCAEWRLVLDNIQEYCPVYEGEKLHVKAYSKQGLQEWRYNSMIVNAFNRINGCEAYRVPPAGFSSH